LGAAAILERLKRIAGDTPAVLLCWESPDAEYCHRWTLSRWFYERAGIVTPELKAGMLPKRPNAPQLALFDNLLREERA